MNKRQIVASLNKIANELDNSGLYNEATTLTKIMKKLAQPMGFGMDDAVDVNKKMRSLMSKNPSVSGTLNDEMHQDLKSSFIKVLSALCSSVGLSGDKVIDNILKPASRYFDSQINSIGDLDRLSGYLENLGNKLNIDDDFMVEVPEDDFSGNKMPFRELKENIATIIQTSSENYMEEPFMGEYPGDDEDDDEDYRRDYELNKQIYQNYGPERPYSYRDEDLNDLRPRFQRS